MPCQKESGHAGELVLVIRPLHRDGAEFPLQEAQVLAGFRVGGVAFERAAVVERGFAGGAEAIGGVADVEEGVRRKPIVGTAVEPGLGGGIVAALVEERGGVLGSGSGGGGAVAGQGGEGEQQRQGDAAESGASTRWRSERSILASALSWRKQTWSRLARTSVISGSWRSPSQRSMKWPTLR